MNEYVYEGSLDVASGTLDITDPCYNRDVWCQINGADAEPGNYECFSLRQNRGDFGIRVSNCMILLEGIERIDTKTRYLGEIGVDAGMAGFFSPSKPDFDDDEQWNNICDMSLERDANVYTFTDESEGFWTSSGYGDGSYPVYALYAEGYEKPVGYEIVFID